MDYTSHRPPNVIRMDAPYQGRRSPFNPRPPWSLRRSLLLDRIVVYRERQQAMRR